MKAILSGFVALVILMSSPALAGTPTTFAATGGPCDPTTTGVIVADPDGTLMDVVETLPIGDGVPVGHVLGRCGVSHMGVFAAEASDCDEAGCDFSMAMQAHGWSSVPTFLQLEVRIWTDSENAQGFCVVQSVATQAISCAGDRDDIRASIAAGECTEFLAESDLAMQFPHPGSDIQDVRWGSRAFNGFEVCRDAAGTPHVRALPEA